MPTPQTLALASDAEERSRRQPPDCCTRPRFRKFVEVDPAVVLWNELRCDAGAGAEYRAAGGSRSRARNRPAPAQRRLEDRSPAAQRAGTTPARSGAPMSHANRRLESSQGLGSEAAAARSAHAGETRIYRLSCDLPDSPRGRLPGRRHWLRLAGSSLATAGISSPRKRRDRDVPNLYLLSMGIDSRPHRPP